MTYNKVKKLKKYQTPLLKKNWYLTRKVLKKNYFSEAQGRNWRFRSFARLYLVEKYDIIITGHTATDQSETALLQLVRGTSFSGLTRFRLSKHYKRIFPKYPNYSIFF